MILNERDYIEQVIAENAFLGKPVTDLGIAAKYYFADGYAQRDVRRKLDELLLRCDPSANLVLWSDTLDKQVKRAYRRKLIEMDYVPVTASEIEVIDALPNRTLKKLAFSYLCVAKYYNGVNEQNSDWANLPVRDICSMGGIAIPVDKQYELRGELADRGLLQLSLAVDNVNARVLFVDHGGQTVMMVDDMRNLGNQYFMYKGEKYVKCALCGLVISRKSNRQIYCSKCASKNDVPRKS